MKRLLALSVLLLLTGCNPADNRPREFVCEIQGELSERHVGVRSAYEQTNALWRIKYVDGDGATRYYRQREGETCAVEVLP